MENKKVLIVTYYWPPGGGSGVQRWLKFVKYLTRLGWEPIVFTPENPLSTVNDSSLLNDVPDSMEVIKLPIWEPYDLFFRLQKIFGKKNAAAADFISTGKKSLFQRISSWLRGNLFIPDARIFWVKPSVKFLDDFIKSNEITRVVTTGPPHSMHLIGMRLKQLHPVIHWVADFRDPWSEWDLLDTLSLTSWARAHHRKLEKEVLVDADRVVTIAPYHVDRLKNLGGRAVDLITNGFDHEDFVSVVHKQNEQFTIRHIGVVDELRDPRPVMEVIKKICIDQPDLIDKIRIEFIGSVNSNFKDYVAQHSALVVITSFRDHMPHDRLLEVYGTTDLQLLVLAHTAIAPGNLPGKFFEYMASGNPILAIGPTDGDAAKVLKETNSGRIFEHADSVGIEEAILDFYRRWESGHGHEVGDVSKYSREAIAKQLIELL
ncbi:MAG: glycosyltransferase family 4 protein [Cyclobacteriaceae bacterium]